MRLLLDECVPRRLKRDLLLHDVLTVAEAGWAGLKNGALLRAADGGIDVLVTVDQGLQHQQNLSGLRVAIAILVAPSNDIDDLRPMVPALLRALEGRLPGTITRVGP
jgi:hypothetical protein